MPPVGIAGNFGSGVSPIVADGTVVLVRDDVKDAKIIALDLATGSPKWETKRQSPTSYSTPVVWETPRPRGSGRRACADDRLRPDQRHDSGSSTPCRQAASRRQ